MNRREVIKFGSISMALPALSFGVDSPKPLLPMKEEYAALWEFALCGNQYISPEQAEKAAQFLCGRMDACGVWRGHPMKIIYIPVRDARKVDPLGQRGYFGCKSADESGLEEAYRRGDADSRMLIAEFAKQWHGA